MTRRKDIAPDGGDENDYGADGFNEFGDHRSDKGPDVTLTCTTCGATTPFAPVMLRSDPWPHCHGEPLVLA